MHRNAALDNMRFVAAALVVVGHFIEPIIWQSDIAATLYYSTWPLRIPVLVVLAGYFSKSEPLDRPRLHALVRNVLLVYLVFHLIGSVVRFLVSDRLFYDPTSPTHGMWFLLSLFCWRLILPCVARVRFLPAISITAAFCVGVVDSVGGQFSASRTVVLFPLFLLGHWLGRGGLRRLQGVRGIRPVAGVALLTVMVSGAALGSRIPFKLLHSAHPYDAAGLAGVMGQGTTRLLLLAAASVAVMSLLLLVPPRSIQGLTYLGTGSMYAYLLHLPLFACIFGATDLYAHVNSRHDVLLLILGATALAVALASHPTRRALSGLIQPRATWMFAEQRRSGESGDVAPAAVLGCETRPMRRLG